jgi:hypothetical protein
MVKLSSAQLQCRLDSAAAPDELVERLQTATRRLAAGQLQLLDKQQEAFDVQYGMLQPLQLWLQRPGRVGKVAEAMDVLLGLLGV